jgi:AcrR family transcriptional regulator
MRRDTLRNRRQLIRSAVTLLEDPGRQVSLTDIANHAEVSPATAYRQFASVEEILDAFRSDVGSQLLEFSRHQTGSGEQRLAAVSRYWVELVLHHGAAMVQHRSPRGYLERLWHDTGYLEVQADSVRLPLAEAMADWGLRDIGDEAVFLWNILFDPREIFDLRNTVGLSATQIGTQLLAALRGALQGWAAARAARPAIKRAEARASAPAPLSSSNGSSIRNTRGSTVP